MLCPVPQELLQLLLLCQMGKSGYIAMRVSWSRSLHHHHHTIITHGVLKVALLLSPLLRELYYSTWKLKGRRWILLGKPGLNISHTETKVRAIISFT